MTIDMSSVPFTRIAIAITTVAVIFSLSIIFFGKRNDVRHKRQTQEKTTNVSTVQTRPQQTYSTTKKSVSWAPSVVTGTMVADGTGEWDTNRNPATHVANVSKGFPVSDGGCDDFWNDT